MLKKIDTWLKALERVVGLIASAALAIVTVIILTQVFYRYLLGSSFSWAEELARYLIVWISFVLLGLAFNKNELLSLDLVVSFFPRNIRKLLDSISHCLILFFLIYIIKYGSILANFEMGQKSAAMSIPMGYIYAAIPVGSIIMALFVLRSLFRIWLVEKDKQ
jgi:TRAP-type transport system small permease protein